MHIEHVLQPVAAVRDTHVHPVSVFVRHAAVPDLVEAENVFVEMIGGGAILDHNSEVNDALRDAFIGKELAEVTAVQRARHELYELDIVSIGIIDVEAAVPVEQWLELVGDLDATAGEVSPQLLGIGGLK